MLPSHCPQSKIRAKYLGINSHHQLPLAPPPPDEPPPNPPNPPPPPPPPPNPPPPHPPIAPPITGPTQPPPPNLDPGPPPARRRIEKTKKIRKKSKAIWPRPRFPVLSC